MKTIEQVFDEFLKEQQTRLKPRTYEGYQDTIYFFGQCLNGFACQFMGEKDGKLYNGHNKQFCAVFGPDKIGPYEVAKFLNDFMIRKVVCSKELMKTVGRVMRKFVKWMNEKGYMDEEKYKDTSGIVDKLKDGLPNANELCRLIYDYIEDNPHVGFIESEDGYFRVTRIEPCKLWLEYNGEDRGTMGPVFVSNEISSLCKEGWVINLKIGRTGKGWKMLESGYVYPR